MEKFLANLDSSGSFAKKKSDNAGHHHIHIRHTSDSIDIGKSDGQEKVDQQNGSSNDGHLPQEASLPDQFFEEVDRFVSDDHGSKTSEIPKCIDVSFYKMVESMIVKYESKETSSSKFGQNEEQDALFLESLKCISKLINKITTDQFSSRSSNLLSSLNNASIVLHRGMSLLDEEFRLLLDQRRIVLDSKTPKTPKHSSFNFSSQSSQDSDRCLLPDSTESNEDEGFPNFSTEAISNMNKIATAMVSCGYEAECCMAYTCFRRNAFREVLNKLGFDSITIDDAHRMQWESLEREIASWISIFKHCYRNLFPGERKFSDAIFSEYPSISQRLFSELAAAVITPFLSFSEVIALTKRSAERLFKFLDMCETLNDLLTTIDDSYSKEISQDLTSEIAVVKSQLAEAAASIFCELENSIKSDQGRTPVPSGQVHPSTRYTMNYLKYACEYRDTLEEVFRFHHKNEGFDDAPNQENHDINEHLTEMPNDDGTPKKSPFAIELIAVMDLLDANLEMKSRLYRDPALRCVFLMNNGRYILQKIKGSNEIHNMMGVTWCRKRSTQLRQYHKNYQRETWSRVLQCISHEGLQANGKVVKAVLKERFKNFNALFEEIHRTQSTWVVSDEQLQSELRVSISAVVTPAYRSFVGRFKQYLEGRSMDKYIKYQPEDIETLIDELFDGNPMSMGRRRN